MEKRQQIRFLRREHLERRETTTVEIIWEVRENPPTNDGITCRRAATAGLDEAAGGAEGRVRSSGGMEAARRQKEERRRNKPG